MTQSRHWISKTVCSSTSVDLTTPTAIALLVPEYEAARSLLKQMPDKGEAGEQVRTSTI